MTRKELDINWKHHVLGLPTLLLLMYGVAIGLIISPLVMGIKTGIKIGEDFWGYDKDA